MGIAEVEARVVKGELHVGIGPGHGRGNAFQLEGDVHVFRGRVGIIGRFGRIGQSDGVGGLAVAPARVVG